MRNSFEQWYSNEIVKQLDGKEIVDSENEPIVPVDLSLTRLKPLSAKWLVQMFQHIKNNPDIVRSGFRETVSERKWYKYKGHCYYYSEDLTDWFTAENNCRKMDGYLVKFDEKAENEAISSHRALKKAYSFLVKDEYLILQASNDLVLQLSDFKS
ncbi:MRC [Mytilus coruscus]|uniref:MRC n=1 Tax=Mytilus coruscus TaxID=42192 RepID=A0A6J8DYK2_MYTCO|nr:MRC [Mytilus coruscus]